MITDLKQDKSSQLLAALDYAKQGWPVLPVNGKIPLIKNWVKEASTEPEKIEDWWKAHPMANVGLVTGERSGFFVLDVDVKGNGLENLKSLETEFGKLPETLKVNTGGGGNHYYFKCPFL